MTTLSRLTSLVAVIAMMLSMMAVPAFAVVSGTATITTGSLLSGQGGNVTVRIANNASTGTLGSGIGAGARIDVFQIEVPLDLVDVDLSNVVLPAGWLGGYDDELGFLFGQADKDDADGDGTTSQGLAPGSTMDITIGVTADRIPDDRTRPFHTFASDNGGTTLTHVGSPEVTSRILEVVSGTVVKPTTATNTNPLEVTANQTNTRFDVRVTNHGTQGRTVTANVARVSGPTPTTTAGSAPIASGASATIKVPVSDWGSTTGTFVGNGIATTINNSAATPKRLDSVSVQAKFAANLVANSLNPRSIAQGTTTDVTYRINKTAGAQPVSGTAAFLLDGTELKQQAQTFDVTNNEKTVLFNGVTFPNLLNGKYPANSTFSGADANGAAVSLSFNLGDITLDNLLPVVNLKLNVGEPDVPGAVAATTSGRTITYSGNIGLNQGTEDCTSCTIDKVELIALPSGQRFPMNVNNNGGKLGGSGSFTFPAGTETAYAEITVTRTINKKTVTSPSNTVLVDLVRPTLASAITFRDTDADKIVLSVFDDGLLVDVSAAGQNQGNPVNWSVDNNQVTAVTGQPQANGATQITLTLRSRLNANATPTVSYAVALGERIHDRVSLTMADQAIDAIDGIIPDAPVIEAVSGMGLQDGEFWTNDSTPEVTLSELVAGNFLEIYVSADETPNQGELAYVGQIDAETETVPLNDLGNIELKGYRLIARMSDNAGNLGVIDSELFNLDFTAAKIVDFTVSGQDITVEFDEPVVRGRNAAFDWAVQATSGGSTAFRTVTAVSGSATTRVLTVSSQSWDGSGTVNAVRYKFRGFSADDRYEDRATNPFADTLYTK